MCCLVPLLGAGIRAEGWQWLVELSSRSCPVLPVKNRLGSRSASGKLGEQLGLSMLVTPASPEPIHTPASTRVRKVNVLASFRAQVEKGRTEGDLPAQPDRGARFLSHAGRQRAALAWPQQGAGSLPEAFIATIYPHSLLACRAGPGQLAAQPQGLQEQTSLQSPCSAEAWDCPADQGTRSLHAPALASPKCPQN